MRSSDSLSGRTWPEQVRLGELEEARAVRVERLRRERLDRRLEPLVERVRAPTASSASAPASVRSSSITSVHAASPLDERRAHGEENGDRADRETDEESSDDHGADRR